MITKVKKHRKKNHTGRKEAYRKGSTSTKADDTDTKKNKKRKH